MNGSLITVDNRPALRLERNLDHRVERVWRAITEPEELRRRHPGIPKWDLEPGASFTNEEGQGAGQITEIDPPRLLAYTWGDERFRFELQPTSDGCLLVFTHVFDDRALGAQHAAGWETYLNRLDAPSQASTCPRNRRTSGGRSCTTATRRTSASTPRSEGARSHNTNSSSDTSKVEDRRRMTTFVLIHGAADSAWHWHLLVAELRKRGHDAVATDLPCDDESAGLSEYTDTVVRHGRRCRR